VGDPQGANMIRADEAPWPYLLLFAEGSEGTPAYLAASLGRLFYLFGPGHQIPQPMWLFDSGKPPSRVGVDTPASDFTTNRSASAGPERAPPWQEAMQATLQSAQAIGLKSVAGSAIAALPAFVSGHRSHRPAHHDFEARMLVHRLCELPDVLVSLETTRAIWEAINRQRRFLGANKLNDPKLRSLATRVEAAQSEIPCGIFLPVEMDTPAGPVFGALRLSTPTGPGSMHCTLYMLDGDHAPARGTRLRRIVLWEQNGNLKETRAEIAEVL
jgi:hypothetical protein